MHAGLAGPGLACLDQQSAQQGFMRDQLCIGRPQCLGSSEVCGLTTLACWSQTQEKCSWQRAQELQELHMLRCGMAVCSSSKG